MSGPSSPRGGRPPSGDADDGWGPATAVRSGSSRGRASHDESRPGSPGQSSRDESSRGGSSRRSSRTRDDQAPRVPRHGATAVQDGWSPAGPAPRGQQRANKAAERRTERSLRDLEAQRAALSQAPERGLPWWAALGVLAAIALIGGLVDTIGSIDVSGGFNIGIVVAAVVAILLVKRSHMFPVVIAPPIVYSLAAVFQLYLRSDGLDDKRVVFDAAANYLVYGFPAIAAATAAVLIIAGIRLIRRK